MTADDILLAAASGAEPPDLNGAEALLFCRMRESYRAFKAGEISKAQGAERKAAAMTEYRQLQNALERGTQAAHTLSRIFTAMEQTASAYRKERSLDTADQLMQAVYRLEERRTQNDDHDPVK